MVPFMVNCREFKIWVMVVTCWLIILAASAEAERIDINQDNVAPTAGKVADELRFVAGDTVAIKFAGTSELDTEARISERGALALPGVGSIHAAGLTPEELQSIIRKAYIDRRLLKDPQITVIAREYGRIAVLGEVKTPGMVPYFQAHTLLEAIAVVGGLTDRGSRTITIIHAGNPEPARASLPIETDQWGSANVRLQPGDTILVPRLGAVYIVGYVAHPGMILLERSSSVSLLQAIAMANGVSPGAALNKTRLLHRAPDGQITERTLPLKEILATREKDVDLHAEDIVIVRESRARSIFTRTVDTSIAMGTSMVVLGVR